jgi:hypothetical protein
MVDKDKLSTIQSHSDRSSVSYLSHPVAIPLARLANRFFAKTSELYNNSREDVHDRLAAVLAQLRKGSNPQEKMRIAAETHSMFQAGLGSWLESLTGLTQEYFHKLVKIGVAHSEWTIEDPVEWARLRMLELIAKELAPISTGMTKFDFWFRWVCEGHRGEDTLTGYIEPWRAPVWSWKYFSFRWWEKNGFPEQLSADLTAKIIRSEARLWQQRLPNEVGFLADEAGLAFDLEKADALTRQRSPLEGVVHDKSKSKKVTPEKKKKKRYSRNRATVVSSQEFVASPDYRTVCFRGKEYSLTRNQSTIVRLLHEAYTGRTPAVGKELLLAAIQAETSRVRDSFRNSPLWGSLIIPGKRRGAYQLNLG